jgi:hypothetical protein
VNNDIEVRLARKKKKKLLGLSPQPNYTDRATAAIDEVVPTFADRGVLRGQRNSRVNERYICNKIIECCKSVISL